MSGAEEHAAIPDVITIKLLSPIAYFLPLTSDTQPSKTCPKIDPKNTETYNKFDVQRVWCTYRVYRPLVRRI